MESSKAVNCVKAFSTIHNNAVTFERTDESTGYIIRIDGIKYESDKQKVRNIAKQLCLVVKEEANSMAIL